VETTDAVLHQEPEPLLRRKPDLPADFDRIVRKCLMKAPDARYQRMSEVTEALRALETKRDAPPSWAAFVLRRAVSRVGSRRILPVVVAATSLLGALVVYRRLDRERPVPRLSSPVQVTVAGTVEDYPTWSPDGRTIAYESDQNGNWDIWLAPVAGGPAADRTADSAAQDRYPSWSPDGSRIAFWSDRDGGGYYDLTVDGGAVERLASTPTRPGSPYYSPPQWSSDGTEIAYVVYQLGGARLDSFVEIRALANGKTRRMRLPGSQECRLDLAWSVDGRYLSYVDAAQQLSETTAVRVLRLSDGSSVAVTDARANVRGPFWSRDGRYLYYSANRVGPSDLWRQRITEGGRPEGQPQQVTTAVQMRHAALSADGRRVAFSKGRWVANLWRVPILKSRPATWTDSEQMTFEEAYIEFVDVSRDGRRLLFSSDRAGNQDLWTMPIGGEMTRLTTDPSPDWAPRWSPDESEIAFYSSRSGDREIWVMPAAGGIPRRLTFSPGLDAGSNWSPDGRTIAFRSERTGNSEIWTIGATAAASDS
jgi:eukaryotic-like serine/threonine-protein kinase